MGTSFNFVGFCLFPVMKVIASVCVVFQTCYIVSFLTLCIFVTNSNCFSVNVKHRHKADNITNIFCFDKKFQAFLHLQIHRSIEWFDVAIFSLPWQAVLIVGRSRIANYPRQENWQSWLETWKEIYENLQTLWEKQYWRTCTTIYW